MGSSVIAVGDIFQGRYEVLSGISEGGFGEVFLARQLTTGQLVALKTLRRQHFEYHENQLARFRREVKLCASLHHPHIVTLIDFGTTEQGLLYTIFEFVPGKHLGDVLGEEGCLTPQETVRLMGQVLDALSCAHEAGIIHRDLKPGNIMVVSTGARRNVKVLDFGIGAILPSARDLDPGRLTNTMEHLGTPAYTAPELLRGNPPAPASDLYSWALVFIECLTGQRVMEAKAIAEIIHDQLSPDPIAIPPELQAHRLGSLLRLVTAKDVAQRKITASALLRQLEACNLSSLKMRNAPRQRGSEADTLTTRIVKGDDQASGEPARASWRMAEAELADSSDERPLAGSERRQITAVCCAIDIAADDAGNLDVEVLDTLLNEQQTRAHQIARRFEGHVASVLGHQALICYGYPVARADDARRAALSSLAIRDELEAQSQALRARGIALDVRIGIHTGLVVAQNLQRATDSNLPNVLGSTPAVAARVNAFAAPGSIVLSDSARRLLSTEFALEELGEQSLGRASRPMMLFRLAGLTRRMPTATTGSAEVGVALVGRDEELALLRHRWHQSRQGMGQLVMITGEPGIGKSRLLRELSAMIRDLPHIRLEARCTPEGQHSAMRPVIELLMLHLDIHEAMPVETRRERLETLLASQGLDVARHLPFLGSLLELPPDARYPLPQLAPQRQKAMMLESVLSLISAMASDEPMLLTVEDLHWADATTIELVSMLVEELSSLPVCLVITARPELTVPWHRSSATQIPLARLDQDGIRQMVLHLAREKSLPADVLDEVIHRTDGVPLFVEELTRMILESEILAEQEKHYSLMGTVADLAVPPTLRDSLMARLDRLGAAKATAQLAAVIGREFGLDLLGKLSPLPDADLQAHLSQLAGAELIHRRRRLQGDIYSFKHALIQEIAYESLLKSTRRECHTRIAQVLEKNAPELAGTRPELLARHFAGAGEIAKAITYVERAGQLALERFANAEALGYMRQALTWLDAIEGQPQHGEMELRCNMISIHALGALRGLAAPEVEQLIERCQSLVSESDDPSSTFLVHTTLNMYHQLRAHHRVEMELAQRYREHAEAAGNPMYVLDALRALGTASYCMGRLEEARGHLEQSIALYDSLEGIGLTSIMGFDAKVLCRMVLSFVLWTSGYPEQALAEARGNVDSSRKLDSLINIAGALSYLGGIHHFNGEHEHARQVADELIEIARGYGGVQFEALGILLRCWATHEVAQADAILAGFSAFGQALSLPYWHATVAESEAATGQLDAALARLQRCAELARSTEETYYLPEIYRLQGDVLCQRASAGDHESAEEYYQQAADIARSQSARLLELRAVLAHCRLRAHTGRMGDVLDRLRDIYGWFTEGLDTPILRKARAFLDSARA